MSALFGPAGLIIINDLLLFFRECVAEKWRSGFNLAIAGLLLVFLHLVSLGFFVGAEGPPPTATQAAAWVLVGFLMLVAGLHHAMRLVSRSADLDLLLSSPIPRTAIQIARVAGATASNLLATAFIALPALNGALLVHGSELAWGYLVWLLLAIATAGLTSGVTSLTVQRLGSIRLVARIQTGATILLAAVGLALQSRALLPPGWVVFTEDLLSGSLEWPWALLPVRASHGDPGSLLVLGFASLAGTAFATWRLPWALNSGLSTPAADSTPLSTSRPLAFSTGSAIAALRKDLRLLARDAALLSKVLPFAVFALPGFFLTGRALHAPTPTVLAVYATFAVVVMSTQLGKLSAQQEECWDMIGQSPSSVVSLQRMKVTACLIAPLVIGMLPAATIAILGRPGLAIVSLAAALFCGIGATWMEVSEVRAPTHAGVMAREKNPDSITPGRLVAALAFVLNGPLGVGLVAYGLTGPGLILLGVSIAVALFTCGFMRPHGIGS